MKSKKKKKEVAEVLIYTRIFSYTIFRLFFFFYKNRSMTPTWKKKAEIWKQAVEEVMCYSHHLEINPFIWYFLNYRCIILFIFNKMMLLVVQLFAASGVILIRYSQNDKQKVLRLASETKTTHQPVSLSTFRGTTLQ